MRRKIVLILGAALIVGLLALNWLKLMSVVGESRFAPPQGNQLGRVFFLEGNFKLPQNAEKQPVKKTVFKGRRVEFYQVKGLQMTVKLDGQESYTVAPMLLDNDYFGLRLTARKPARDYRRIASIKIDYPGQAPVEIKDLIVGDGRIDLGVISLGAENSPSGKAKPAPAKTKKSR